MKAVASISSAALIAVSISISAQTPESKSAPLAKQLAAALEASKLDSIAARDPSNPTAYVGALYLPGVELLTISATYVAPALLDGKLAKREYRDVYTELNTASVQSSRILIEDVGADGLKTSHEEIGACDTYQSAGTATAFNGNWKRQQLSESQYLKALDAADERYRQILTALLAELKKGS